MSPETSLEVWGIVKITIAWVLTFLGALTLNGILSTVALSLTIVFTYYQIQKVRKELKVLEAKEKKE